MPRLEPEQINYNSFAANLATAVDGAAAPTHDVMIGGKVFTDVPTAEANGDVVAFWMDAYRRLVLRGADLTSYTLAISDPNPALMRKYGPHTWPQLAAPGVTTSFNCENWKNIIIAVTVASIDTNVVVQAEGSMDDTNFFPIAARDNSITVPAGNWTISGAQGTAIANDTYALHLKPVSMNHLRFRFVSEAGGTNATIVPVAMCGNGG